jgi:Bacterial Ig-like domain (group 1)/Regulator of chromosome condensation (RCC1) repeat
MSTTRDIRATDDGGEGAIMIFLLGMDRARAYGGAIAMCCLMTAIGCEDPVGPRAATMSAISATTQDAVAGQAIRPAPTVVVRDAEGNPVAGIRVTFFDSAASRAVVMTGADGKATVDWYARSLAGVDRMTVSADGLPNVVFVADVRAGPASQLVPDLDLDQVGLADETLPVQPSVRVVDNYGNPVSGISVTFTAAGAAASSIEHATAVSDTNGHAIAGAWKLGSEIGIYTLTAAAAGVPATPVIFRARIHAPFAASSLAVGGTSSCAIASTGTYCWGSSFGGYAPALTPRLVGSAPPLVALAMSDDHACGLTNSGAAYCWGENWSGQLGLGTSGYTEPPGAVVGGLSFATLVVGNAFTCGLTTDQQAYCWGDNSLGQLGISSTGNRSVPTAVATPERIATMAAGFRHACATAASGTTYCWGADDLGQLGRPAGEVCEVPGGYYYSPLIDVSCSRTPLPLPNAPGAFAALTASMGTCGLLGTGEAYCWGFSRSTIPPEGRFVTLAAGFQSVCGITTTQSISCWSYVDPTAPPSTVTAVRGVVDPIGLAGGYEHWCVIGSPAKTAYCWGGNGVGQLGNGTLVPTTTPRPVASP